MFFSFFSQNEIKSGGGAYSTKIESEIGQTGFSEMAKMLKIFISGAKSR